MEGSVFAYLRLPLIALIGAFALTGIATALLRKAGRKQLDADYVESDERLGLVVYLYCGAQILMSAAILWLEFSMFGLMGELAGKVFASSPVLRVILIALMVTIACNTIPWLALIFWELFHPQFLKSLLAFGLRITKFLGIVASVAPLLMIVFIGF